MKHIETELEKRCIKEARRQGWSCWKNEKNGNKGIPDFSILRDGVFKLVEFKRDGRQKLSADQQLWFNRHQKNCILISDFDEFLRIL